MLGHAKIKLYTSSQYMNTWDQESVRERFASTARNAETYANELSRRIKGDPNGQSAYVRELHDEHLAKWFVYDSFACSSCLESREKFLADARVRLASESGRLFTGSFSKDDCFRYWRQYMDALIKEFEKA
jgi:hypothetical protein